MYRFMFTFHYLICKKPIKNNGSVNSDNNDMNSMNSKHSQYRLKKLIFENNQLSSSDDLVVNEDKLELLLKDLVETQYTEINDSKIDLDSFLKNVELSKIN